MKTAEATTQVKHSSLLNFNSPSRGGGPSKQFQLLASSKATTRKQGTGTTTRETNTQSKVKATWEAVVDSVKMGNEQLQGLISREIRDQLFSNIAGH